MNCNWSVKKLGDLVKFTSGGTPSKSNEAYWGGDIPWISASSMDSTRYSESDLKVTTEGSKNGTRLVPKDTVLLLVRGGALHNKIPVGITTREVTFNQDVKALVPKTDEITPWYLLFWLISIKKTLLAKVENTGIGAGKLDTKILQELEVPLPPQSELKRLEKFCKALDDKIILNSDTNQTLEQMAQAIFKSWFVDFDPVKAKMNREQPEGMDAATASLFPEKLDSETGIPSGWSQGVIADIAKLNAKSWTKKNQPEQVHYVDLANTKNGVIETVTTYDFDEAPSRARRILNSGDTIVGTVRPGNRSFAFIGETEQPLTGSTGFAVLSPKEEFWTSFVYLATTNDDTIDEYARLADGGAYPAIKPVVVADTPCVIPTTDVAQKFWQLTGAMLQKAHQNRLENEELAQLRDTLLPKLLSGEIELGATEAMEPSLVSSPIEQYL
ncbi:TPA: restriction endonuclease subunit S [Vibrio vulnificus]|nr:restriction endonuclease subunit S [Vibrio vulnificus]HAS8438345.1 restriction endonuclease subunit S [Vibrio vulnificus]